MTEKNFQLIYEKIKNNVLNKFPSLADKIDYKYYSGSDEYFILIYDEELYFNNTDFQKTILDIKMNILWKSGIYNIFVSYEEKSATNDYDFLITLLNNKPREISINDIKIYFSDINQSEFNIFETVNKEYEILCEQPIISDNLTFNLAA